MLLSFLPGCRIGDLKERLDNKQAKVSELPPVYPLKSFFNRESVEDLTTLLKNCKIFKEKLKINYVTFSN